MNKNETKIIKILAEIQNPDKRVEDVAFELFKLGEEYAADHAAEGKAALTGDDVEKSINVFMERVHKQIEILLKKEYQ